MKLWQERKKARNVAPTIRSHVFWVWAHNDLSPRLRSPHVGPPTLRAPETPRLSSFPSLPPSRTKIGLSDKRPSGGGGSGGGGVRWEGGPGRGGVRERVQVHRGPAQARTHTHHENPAPTHTSNWPKSVLAEVGFGHSRSALMVGQSQP